MEQTVLDNVEPSLPFDDLLTRLRVGMDSDEAGELRELVLQAETIAKPKAVCGVAYVDDRGDDYVVLDGVRFDSRVLVVNLLDSHRVFPYVATCGRELEAWANGLDDILHKFWSEAIREMTLRKARTAVEQYLDRTFGVTTTSRMGPGSLSDWPIQQQVPLFKLVGDTETSIGVCLTESLLMVPTKSVSGIFFGSAGGFESCMLCPRSECQNRRAPYDPALYEQSYRKQPA